MISLCNRTNFRYVVCVSTGWISGVSLNSVMRESVAWMLGYSSSSATDNLIVFSSIGIIFRSLVARDTVDVGDFGDSCAAVSVCSLLSPLSSTSCLREWCFFLRSGSGSFALAGGYSFSEFSTESTILLFLLRLLFLLGMYPCSGGSSIASSLMAIVALDSVALSGPLFSDRLRFTFDSCTSSYTTERDGSDGSALGSSSSRSLGWVTSYLLC